jgi:hypothetical protein
MEMNKQRKILVGVLCTGVLGLVVDRMFLVGPESAEADDSDVIEQAAAPPTIASPAGSQPALAVAVGTQATDTLPSYASLTERLVKAQQQTSETESPERADPFALPDQWQAQRSTPLPLQQEPEDTASGQRLTVVFKLDGTVRSLSKVDGKEELMAVITGGGLDSRAIRVGQGVRVADEAGMEQSYVLVEVGPRYVVWTNKATDERIEMRVE